MNELDGFNAISPWYDGLARLIFGEAILNSQLHLIGQIPPCSKVLILGGGTGEILPQLIHHDVEVWFIDASSAMISRAASRVEGLDKVHFIHGTHLDIPPNEKFDCVMSCFFLDMFRETELREVVNGISFHLNGTGKLLVSDFVAETRWHRVLLRMMYAFFAVTTGLRTSSLPPWNAMLLDYGFSIVSERRFCRGFIKSVSLERRLAENEPATFA